MVRELGSVEAWPMFLDKHWAVEWDAGRHKDRGPPAGGHMEDTGRADVSRPPTEERVGQTGRQGDVTPGADDATTVDTALTDLVRPVPSYGGWTVGSWTQRHCMW